MNKALEDLQAGRDPFSTAPEKESDPEFYYKAAKLCIWLPIISGIFTRASSETIKVMSAPNAALIAIVMCGLCGVMLLVSVICGLIALCGISKHGTQRILLRSVFGLLISFVLLFALGSGFMQGYRKAITDRQLSRDLRHSTEQLQAGLKMDVEKGHGISVAQTEANFEKFKSVMDTASKKASGDNALLARASSAYLDQWRPLMKDYSAALTELQKPSLLDMSDVAGREQLAAKKDLVRKFLAANETLATFIKTKGDLYRQEMQKSGLPAEKIEAAMREYNAKVVSTHETELALQIREDDRQLGAALIGMLGVLDANWGRWKWSSERNKVVFEQDAVLDQYIGFRDKLEAAGKDQQKIQAKLVNLVSR